MKFIKITLLLLCGLLAACSHGPEPILYGKEACAHCKMTIMDKHFACEVVTAKGKVWKFDAVECMLAYLKQNPSLATEPKTSLLINDFEQPGEFANARKAWFLHDASLASPMGGNLAAYINYGTAHAARRDSAAAVHNWTELIKQNR